MLGFWGNLTNSVVDVVSSGMNQLKELSSQNNTEGQVDYESNSESIRKALLSHSNKYNSKIFTAIARKDTETLGNMRQYVSRLGDSTFTEHIKQMKKDAFNLNVYNREYTDGDINELIIDCTWKLINHILDEEDIGKRYVMASATMEIVMKDFYCNKDVKAIILSHLLTQLSQSRRPIALDDDVIGEVSQFMSKRYDKSKNTYKFDAKHVTASYLRQFCPILDGYEFGGQTISAYFKPWRTTPRLVINL